MTTATAAEVAARKRGGPPPPLYTMLDDMREHLLVELAISTRVQFPNALYARDPVAFFRVVLGVEPWSKQREILEAVRDHDRVAICSGHKISKSHSAAGLALWWFCSFADARVIMSSTTSRQVDQILWRELRMLRARGGRCVACKAADPDGLIITRPCEHSALIDGEQGELARTGLKAADFREIVGFTAREAEAVAGVSGKRLLYILDEASGIPDQIYEAIEGNRAGGAKLVLFGNGTRNEGEFFEAFYSKADLYKTIRVSSESTPNVIERRTVIPGLATHEWIEEKRKEWGVDSALYKVRVLGQHATFEEGKIFSLHRIAESEQRWHITPDAGRLFIGVDPAGETGTGDETAFSARRGLKHLLLRTALGLNDDQHLIQILILIAELKLPRETPVVVVDREGSIGSSLFGKLRNYTDEHPQAFELVGVRASDRAFRQPDIYDRVRDELAKNLELWFRDGGAILEDTKLERDLHALQWFQDIRGRRKVTDKKTLRKALGRSPDRYDALALCVWEASSLGDDVPDPPPAGRGHESGGGAPQIDPYGGGDVWRPR